MIIGQPHARRACWRPRPSGWRADSAFPRRARACTCARWSSTATFTPWTASFYHGGDIGERKPDGQFDLPRAKEGGLGALFFSIFVTEDYYPGRLETKQALRMLDTALEQIERNRQTIEIARTATDIERIRRGGKMAAVLDIEGSFDLDGDLGCPSRDAPPGLAVGAAFRAQLDQQLRRLLLLDAEMARLERARPRGHPRDEPPRDGDQRVARLR